MGIAEKYNIEIWRWKGGQWRAAHHDGRHDYKPGEKGERWNENDWKIERNHSGKKYKPIYFRNAEIGPHNTVWVYKNSTWNSIYRRSHGNSDTYPAYLDDITDWADGTIVFDRGITSGLTSEEQNSPNPIIINPDGNLQEEIEIKTVAVLPDVNDSIAKLSESSSNEMFFNEDTEDDSDPELKKKAALQLAALGRHLPELDDAVKSRSNTKIKKIIIKILEEAPPGPTPGTSAITDYISMGLGDYGSYHKTFDTGHSSDKYPDTGVAQGGDALASAAVNYLGELYVIINDSRKLHKILKKKGTFTDTEFKNDSGEINTAFGNILSNVYKFMGTSSSTTGVIATLSGNGVVAVGASASSLVLGPVIGLLGTARNARKAEHARKRMKKLNRALRKFLRERGDSTKDADITGPIKFLIGKNKRRWVTKGFTATSAALTGTGALATGLVAVGAVTAANIWNPVGWSLVGAAALVGLGIVGYKIYRRATRTRRHQKRLEKIGGVANASGAAMNLLSVYRDSKHDPQKRELAKEVLKLFGVRETDLSPSRLGDEDFRSTVCKQFVRHCG